ncbi:two-component sensor histidine kinase [Flavobacterium enshiense DK69]|uniref:histidine kinase n=1 Tax=Flavobacterium enshiense DK69 TaxID=1107311 RepID=V6S7R7_9FLAO|nr:ATP-binding protein [Flavobacterium enshiense]ESU22307.1 two-component sensor histidine kinase [Flavobacterium enshiense DK69]KGO97312.1 histidine kinase [Flavobacterium enshiense DK69]
MWEEGSIGVVTAILGLTSLVVVSTMLIIFFQRKRNMILIKQIEGKKQFEQEIIESQIEIREQILKNISWELHDNIGQLLTLAKIQLQKIPGNPDNIKDVNDNLSNILNEVRALSKVTNPDFICEINLEDAVKIEIDRFNRLGCIESKLEITGTPFSLNTKSEIIIFRILQEFFVNTIKHSKASKLDVFISFDGNKLSIVAEDNGKGFEKSDTFQNGIGLTNMKKRGFLINAEVNLESTLNQGTKLTIIYFQY